MYPLINHLVAGYIRQIFDLIPCLVELCEQYTQDGKDSFFLIKKEYLKSLIYHGRLSLPKCTFYFEWDFKIISTGSQIFTFAVTNLDEISDVEFELDYQTELLKVLNCMNKSTLCKTKKNKSNWKLTTNNDCLYPSKNKLYFKNRENFSRKMKIKIILNHIDLSLKMLINDELIPYYIKLKTKNRYMMTVNHYYCDPMSKVIFV